MLRGLLFIAIFFSFLTRVVNAQDIGKCITLPFSQDAVALDSLSVLPESISVSSELPYQYDLNTGTIAFGEIATPPDSIEVCFTVLPFALHQRVQNRDIAIYDSTAFFEDTQTSYEEGLYGERSQIFPSEGLTKNGSISRGISFGNTQDVFVNSALNLQLEGKLTDDINIRAAITDQNIPFQPEGNTQQLQEFDKVFIQFYNDNASLTAGDIVLKNKPSNFLRYYKNVQGGQFSANYNALKNSPAETEASISIAKGKFASELLEVREGVLGPYKLRGGQNEPFVIVLANSEKVYLDGRLLERGFNYDYTIDYNQGEITFTNKVLITAFSRVRVDFEYADRNYSRTIISGNHYQTLGKLKFFANYYNEKDNPNRPLTFDLSNEEKLYLSTIGDDLSKAVISGVDTAAFNPNLLLYKKIDTLGVPVYVFSTNPDSAKYDVSFSDVGQGKGNYRLTNRNVNGRIYEWIPPVGGVPQGRYEPVIAIPTPSQKQMITVGGEFSLTDYEMVYSEAAISNNDRNLYSDDNADDNGLAYKGGFLSEGRPFKLIKGYTWIAGIDYEYNERAFQPIDRFRYIEFDRNWNFVAPDSAAMYNENIFNFSLGIKDEKDNLIKYSMSKRKRGEAVDGFQHQADISQTFGRFRAISNLFYLKSNGQGLSSDWKKMDASIAYHSKIFVPGYQYSIEQNKIKAAAIDSIVDKITGLPIPLNYYAHTVFLKSNDTLATRFNLNHTLREDKEPFGGVLNTQSRSQTTNFLLESSAIRNHDLNLTFTYRVLENLHEAAQDQLEETIMGRVDWFADLLQNHVRSELTYSIANAQEPRREFVFLRVPTGEGTHTWRDENGDEVQDINEFYEAINPDERNFVKIFVPTDEYILAYSSNLNYRLNFSMPRTWSSAGGLKGFLSRFSNVSAWSIDKKHTDEDAGARFLPFSNAIEDENLLSIRESLRSSLFYNRSNPKFGMDGTLALSERKELLTNGFDTRKNNEYIVNSRFNILRSYNFRVGGTAGELFSASDFLEGRNFQVKYYEITPEFDWLPARNFRLTTKYNYTTKESVEVEAEATGGSATINTLGLECRFTQVSKRTLNFGLKYTHIDFSGEENTPLGYELLEALRPGSNYTWNLNLQQRVADGLQISINYEGRKSSNQDVIHIGRMQISALF